MEEESGSHNGLIGSQTGDIDSENGYFWKTTSE
jgi:hypothetical protein